jgi:hypothetical protein
MLEQRVALLEQLPARMTALESQFVQLREEIRAEFSAIRAEGRAGDVENLRLLREEIRSGDEETRRVLREEIRAGDEETRRVLREEIRAGDEETRRVLREEIRAGDEETRRYMRVLHEEVIVRITVLSESRPASPPRRARR